ncbi:MAG: hypothetical protein GC159_20380 [Phycisphaera sp.]|nr:hypothetical protein [Phycisphaera sp.]
MLKTIHKRLIGLCVVTALVVIIGRATGPSDITDHDQPRTVAYTADMVINHRYALPADVRMLPATKPPMYNWIAAPLVSLGVWDEWALKLPSMLSAIVTTVLTVLIAMHLARRARGAAGDDDELTRAGVDPLTFGLVAGAIYLASYPAIKLAYLARPDPVLVMFLVAGWLCSTLLLDRLSRRAQDDPSGLSSWNGAAVMLQLGLWLSVAGAALSKGPPAAMLLIYVVLAPGIVYGRWSLSLRSGWWWGLPLSLGLTGLWLWFAYNADPQHVTEKLIGHEMVDRVGGYEGSNWRWLTTLWELPAWFLQRNLPWSIFMVLAMIHVSPRRWFRGAFGPATIWIFIVIGFFSLSVFKRDDYPTPAYAAAAALAAYWLLGVAAKYRLTPHRVAIAALLVASLFIVHQHVTEAAAIHLRGVRLHAFADKVRPIIGNDEVIFIDQGRNAFPVLLARHPRGHTSLDECPTAKWLVQPLPDDTDPDAYAAAHSNVVLVSDTLFEVNYDKPGRYALCRVEQK